MRKRRRKIKRSGAGSWYELVEFKPKNKNSGFNRAPVIGVRGFVPFVDHVSMDEIADYLNVQSLSVSVPSQLASLYGTFASNSFGEEFFFYNVRDILGPDISTWDVFGNVDELLLRMSALYDRIQSQRFGKKVVTPISKFIDKITENDIIYA